MVETNIKLKELKLDDDKSVDEGEKSKIDSGNKSEGEKKSSGLKSNNDFDTVIGYIEDMLINDDFHDLQQKYLEKYWEEFVDDEENKHSYMRIFTEYVRSDIY